MAIDLPAGLGKPAERAFAAAGLRSIEDFTRMTRASVERLHGVGPKALGKIAAALAAHGLSFASE